MEFYVQIKELGKRKPKLKKQKIQIPTLETTTSLKTFIHLLVEQQLQAFDDRKKKESIIPFLDNGQIQEQMQHGKVSFSASYNAETVTLSTAQATATQAFEDGLYAIFIDDNQKENLDAHCSVQENSIVTFIRLTFLSGSWF